MSTQVKQPAPPTSSTLVNKLSAIPWLAEAIALLGGMFYLLQSYIFAHTQTSVLDEGAYLYKGYLFVTGQYSIYQEYGPVSNHMPLAFYIPGAVQAIFGSGIRTGRYFAIFLGLLMLLGLWLLARRLGGRWWATAAVLIVAINPAIIKMYSVAVSQVIVSCMLVWSLYFVLGRQRSLWQITLGSILAGLMLLTRVNMTPYLPLLILYIFWQHGRKSGLVAAFAGGAAVVLGHALFWPGIMLIWAKWLPRGSTPFLNTWRPAGSLGSWAWKPETSFYGRMISLFWSIRFHFVAMLGAFAAVLLWSSRKDWKNRFAFRTAVFLCTLFYMLLIAHMWATIWNDACVFCLPGYVAFFFPVGILLLVVTFSSWRRRTAWWYGLVVALFLLVVSAGIGFSAFEDFGNTLLELQIPRILINPTKFESGTAPLGAILVNKFQVDVKVLKRLLPALAGLFIGAFILALVAISLWLLKRRQISGVETPSDGSAGFAYWAMIIFLILGFILSPTTLLGGGYRSYDCDWDTIASYEDVGAHLAQVIPAGSSVYWAGGQSVVPLLYVSDIEIFPAQINGVFSFYNGGEADILEKRGFWNAELAARWLNEADYVLIRRQEYMGSPVREVVNAGDFDELEQTPPSSPCMELSEIRIFVRKP